MQHSLESTKSWRPKAILDSNSRTITFERAHSGQTAFKTSMLPTRRPITLFQCLKSQPPSLSVWRSRSLVARQMTLAPDAGFKFLDVTSPAGGVGVGDDVGGGGRRTTYERERTTRLTTYYTMLRTTLKLALASWRTDGVRSVPRVLAVRVCTAPPPPTRR